MKVKLLYIVLVKLSVYSAGGALLYKAVGWNSLSIQCNTVQMELFYTMLVELYMYTVQVDLQYAVQMELFCISATKSNIKELELDGALAAYEDILPSSIWSQSGILPTKAVISAVSAGARSSDVWRTSWWSARVELSYDVTTILVMREKPKICRPQ